MNFLIGLNGDNWPTAIPLDRVKELRVDPEDMAVTLEFRDDTTRSETLTKAVLCPEAETMWKLRELLGCGEDNSIAATATTEKTPIERCEMHWRARKALRLLGVEAIEDAQQLTPHEIRALKNVGNTTVHEIRRALGEKGLALRGTTVW